MLGTQRVPCIRRNTEVGCRSPQIARVSRNSGTTATQFRRTHVANHSPLGSLVSRNRIPEAVTYLEDSLDRSKRVHALAVGDLLEVLCQQGRHETAWQLLRRLSSSKARLPLQVLHRLLKVAGQHGTVNDVLAVYDHQQQYYGFASTGVQTTLIHALLKAHRKAMPGNLLAYEAWVRLKTSGRQLDAQALLAGIHAAISVGRAQEAENILAALKETAGAVGRPVVSGYNIIMKSYASTGNYEAARKLFATMKSRGLNPDAVTYNTLLTSFVQAGELVRARAVLEKMKREGVQPDEWSYTTYAMGLGQQGQLQEMQEVWQDMQAAGIQPNMATYAAAIDAYASAGQPAAAHQLLQDLLQQQPGPGKRQQQQQQRAVDELEWLQQRDHQQQQQQQQGQRQEDLSPSPAHSGNGCGPLNAAVSEPQPQQQQQQVISERLLRQLYNTVIKGHLLLALDPDSSSSSGANSFDEYQQLLGVASSQEQQQPQRQAAGITQGPTRIQPDSNASQADRIQAASVSAAVAAAAAQQRGQQQEPLGYDAAVALVTEMSQRGVAPGVDTYTHFIDYSIKVGDQAGLQLLLESLTTAGLQPDQVLLTCLLKAAGVNGDHAAALEIFDALMLAAVPSSSSSIGTSSSGSSSPGASSSSSSDDTGTVGSHQQQQRHEHGSQQQRQQQQVQNGLKQQLLPLTATAGPDAAAWNALAAALVQSDRLSDAAAAVDRAVQASSAVGDKTPPVQGFAALIRGYRNAGVKGKAVAALRQFLSLGGKPGRVMCNDVITVCLRDNDLRTARQVVRAMELTGSVSEADVRGYEAWFSRYEERRRATEQQQRGTGTSNAAGVSNSSSSGGVAGSRGPAGANQAAAVERLKWWLGLPNNYYAAADGADRAGGSNPELQSRVQERRS